MKNIRHYDELNLIAVFWQRKWLFLVSFIVCVSVGSALVLWQKKAIMQAQAKAQITQIAELETNQKMSFLKLLHYKHIALPANLITQILSHYQSINVINDFRLYTSTLFFDVYVLWYEGDVDPLPQILDDVAHNPIIKDLQHNLAGYINSEESDVQQYARLVAKQGFFAPMESLSDITTPSGRPINKHYIYLDKDRIAYGKYRADSTEVIKKHQSLNSNKIWGFMLLCSILISIFVVFSWEGLCSLKTRLRALKS